MHDEKALIFLQPAFQTAIWGNGSLLDRYPVAVPAGVERDRVAILWAFSGDPDYPSQVIDGPFAGLTLAEVYAREPHLFGDQPHPWGILPISIAVCHAAQSLSIQVHPQEAYALKHEQHHGKSECWYIVDVDETPADVILGHTAQTLDEFKTLAEAERFDELLLRKPIEKGGFYNLLAGTLHAIQKGTTFIEVCSASPLTYRLYDYHRKDAAGNERPLQQQKFYDNVLIPYQEMTYDPRLIQHGGVRETLLTDNSNFSTRLFEVAGAGVVRREKPYYACFVIEGEGSVGKRAVKAGDSFVVTQKMDAIALDGSMKVLAASG